MKVFHNKFLLMPKSPQADYRSNFKLEIIIWNKVFMNGPSKICGTQPLKNFIWSILEYFIPCISDSVI